MIYFIQAGDGGPIKIGLARDAHVRAKGLQTAHYETLRIIGIVEGDFETETRLHNLFANYRLRGEWFKPCTEILDYISSYCVSPSHTTNTVYSLGNGEHRIIFPQPIILNMRSFLFFGTHKIRIICDKGAENILGYEGKGGVLENFLRSIGVDEQNLQDFRRSIAT